MKTMPSKKKQSVKPKAITLNGFHGSVFQNQRSMNIQFFNHKV